MHEGPVPITGDLPTLSRIRSEHLANKYALDLTQTIRNFKKRDDLLLNHNRFDNVILWFEHDLYDQLQLIQILDFFASNRRQGTSIYLVQADDFLGEQSSKAIVKFKNRQQPVTSEQMTLAQKAWLAFRQSTPGSWAELLKIELTSLPFLKSIVQRMLEELLSSVSGISRTQYQILTLINNGISQPKKLLSESQKMEEAAFMGDWSFFNQLSRLINCLAPLIDGLKKAESYRPQGIGKSQDYLTNTLRLTDLGQAVLGGNEDYTAKNDVDYWWGGTHINKGNLWRWDFRGRCLVNQ